MNSALALDVGPLLLGSVLRSDSFTLEKLCVDMNEAISNRMTDKNV